MALVNFDVKDSDESFALTVDPPPLIGSRFGNGERLFHVVALTLPDPDDPETVHATIRLVTD